MKELQPIEQKYVFSCGVACLYILTKALDNPLSEDEIIDELKITEDGTSWQQMMTFLHAHDYNFRFQRGADYETLIDFNYPIVCYNTNRVNNSGSHFSIVVESDPEKLTVIDPSFGDLFTYSRQDFINRWHDDEGQRTFIALIGQKAP